MALASNLQIFIASWKCIGEVQITLVSVAQCTESYLNSLAWLRYKGLRLEEGILFRGVIRDILRVKRRSFGLL